MIEIEEQGGSIVLLCRWTRAARGREIRSTGGARADENFRTTPLMTISSLRRVLANNVRTNYPISMDMGDASPRIPECEFWI